MFEFVKLLKNQSATLSSWLLESGGTAGLSSSGTSGSILTNRKHADLASEMLFPSWKYS